MDEDCTLLMRLVLRVQRWILTTKRKLLSGEAWRSDVAELALKSAKLLAYIPTVAAIVLAPRHFFRRIDRVARSSKSPYVRPILFLFGSICVSVFIGFVRQEYDLLAGLALSVSNGSAIGRMTADLAVHMPEPSSSRLSLAAVESWLFLVLILAGTPIWLWIVTTAFFPIMALLSAWTSHGKRTVAALIPVIHLNTYKHMRWPRYFWCLFYYCVYFLPVFPLVTIYVYMALVVGPPHWIVGPLTPLWLAILLTGAASFLIRPYAGLLRGAVIAPTRQMISLDLYDISTIQTDLREPHRWLRSNAVDLLSRLNGAWSAFSSCAMRDLAEARRRGSEATSFYENELHAAIYGLGEMLPSKLIAKDYFRPPAFEEKCAELEVKIRRICGSLSFTEAPLVM